MNTISIDEFTNDAAVIKSLRFRINHFKTQLNKNNNEISNMNVELKERQILINTAKNDLTVLQKERVTLYKVQQNSKENITDKLSDLEKIIKIAGYIVNAKIQFKSRTVKRLDYLNKVSRLLENRIAQSEAELKEFEMKYYKAADNQELIISLSDQAKNLDLRIQEITNDLRTNKTLNSKERRFIQSQHDEFKVKLRKIYERINELRDDASFSKAVG